MTRNALALAFGAALCAGPALAQTAPQQSSTGATTPAVISSVPGYSDPMQRLLDAAQHFRDATHAMAGMPAGPRRSDAIEDADRALRETQDAMIQLPPALRADTADENDQQVAMNRLQDAAQDLRKSVQELVDMPAGPDRSEAVQNANQALLAARQAMIDLPRNTAAR